MRTNHRDRCSEILELIDRCLADVEGEPLTGARNRPPASPSHHTS